MGWNQRNARIFCEVSATGKATRTTLSDESLVAVVAGEQGALRISVQTRGREQTEVVGPRGGKTYIYRNRETFKIWFCPWRLCENTNADDILIASGPLDYDRVKHGEAMVRFDDHAIEVYRIIRAMEVMSEP